MTETLLTTDYLTITENAISPLSDQEHLPFWEKDWIVPELKTLLFQQPESEAENSPNSSVLRTYLIIDAHLYTKVRGFFDLDCIDELPVKCLFKRKAAKELKPVAPYLIDMTLPQDAWDDKSKVPDFHRYYFEKQWLCETGIFVRSVASMDDTYCHFRKFTQIRDEQSKWYFCRFWDPKTFIQIVQSLSVANAHYFFMPIHDVVYSTERGAKSIRFQSDTSKRVPSTPIVFDSSFFHTMGLQKKSRFVQSMQTILEKKYPSFCKLAESSRKDFILAALADAQKYDIALERSLGYFILTKWIKQHEWNQWIKEKMATLNQSAFTEIDKMRQLYLQAQ